ncbi:hypothetical protein ACMU_07765 [Actibacterium mucosum KCTC 23349]|uniref:Uncharacterized protein n=1 Tax=Actibacterium mucosum KCTC 23349 TaxID=1454373 RepID=A0A037ZPR7_9RHOB|nr:hypothetical protein [Actibacterium mucosum]KAJ56827.1 hypothetical protein ACMU_07765 [Actibacterium mucosum KCTC 23349]
MKRPEPRLATVPRFTGQRLALAVGIPLSSVPTWVLDTEEVTLEAIPYVLIHAALASSPIVSHVIAPLMAPQFDAYDLAHELSKLRYRGHFVVLLPGHPRLPRPEIVQTELRMACPRAKISIVDQVLN